MEYPTMDLVSLLITLLIMGLVFGLIVYYLLPMLPIPEPFRVGIICIMVIICIIILLSYLPIGYHPRL